MVAYNSRKRINKKSKGDLNMNNNEMVIEVEQEVKEVELQVIYNEEVALDVDVDIDEETLQQKVILDSHIKHAIFSSKDMGKRGILSKQFNAILKGYERTLGITMSEEQQAYLKRLTEVQGANVLSIINAYNRFKTNKEIQERIARKLATNE